jgi:hypothetical protein
LLVYTHPYINEMHGSRSKTLQLCSSHNITDQVFQPHKPAGKSPPPQLPPPHVPYGLHGLPSGCGQSVPAVGGWDAPQAQLRCPDEVDGDTWI